MDFATTGCPFVRQGIRLLGRAAAISLEPDNEALELLEQNSPMAYDILRVLSKKLDEFRKECRSTKACTKSYY